MIANQTTTRIHNKLKIIESLLSQGEMSRAGLAKHLGCSKPAAAENVEGLIRAGLVREIGEGVAASKGGRRPRLLRFNQTFQTIACIDLGIARPTLALGDLAGEMLGKCSLGFATAKIPLEAKKEEMLRTMRDILSHTAPGPDRLGMIVITSPGIFQSGNSLLYTHPYVQEWNEMGLDKILEEAFQVPVVIKNEVNAAALGEFTVGGRMDDCNNMVYVSCGIGLGAGFILDGKLYEGRNFAAGEIGYITDRRSFQGKQTIEDRVSLNALLNQIHNDVKDDSASPAIAKLAREKGGLDLDDIIRAVQAQDRYVLGKIKTIAQELGFILAGVGAMLDVGCMVLGGEYLVFFDLMKPQIEAILHKCTPVAPKLAPSQLGGDAGLYGGFIHGRNQLFQKLDL